ncbi:MAG: hypothetical protein ABI216_05025 [Devosia sp.]
MTAAMAFILFVVSSGNLPDFTALAAFETQAACDAAATSVNAALSSGQDTKHALCLTAESLTEMAKKNSISQ